MTTKKKKSATKKPAAKKAAAKPKAKSKATQRELPLDTPYRRVLEPYRKDDPYAVALVEVADRLGIRPKDAVRLGVDDQNVLATLDPSMAEHVIHKADSIIRHLDEQLYKRVEAYNARFAPIIEPPAVPAELLDTRKTSKGSPIKQRKMIFGKSVTSVIRWMGTELWDEEQVQRVLAKRGVEGVSVNTIRVQLNAGRKQRWDWYGEPAELTEEQQNLLYSDAGK